jgi:hypothetical protein
LLRAAGRTDLAEQVEWVARTRGDGLGYDVRSYDATGAERWIEVKTTNAGPTTPFFLTPNELDVWRSNLERLELRRVFSFSRGPRFYRLQGDPDAVLALEAALWQARPA